MTAPQAEIPKIGCGPRVLVLRVHLDDTAREEVEMGDLGYWPPGKAFCIFFGPTPVSEGAEPRPASPVNVFGKITGDATTLTQVSQGADITIDKEA